MVSHIMQVVAKSILSVLLFLMGLLEEGNRQLKNKKPDEALKSFTAVIEHKQATTGLRELALLGRASAWEQLGKKDKAKADLKQVWEQTTEPLNRRAAVELFFKIGGKAEEWLPKETPEQFFNAMLKHAKDGDFDAFFARTSGQFRDVLSFFTLFAGVGLGDMQKEMMRELGREMKFTKGVYEKGLENFGTGTLTVFIEEINIDCRIKVSKGKWILTAFVDAAGGAEPVVPVQEGKKEQIETMNELKQISLALMMFATDHADNLPANLGETRASYLPDLKLHTWVQPKTRKELPYLYHNNGKQGDVKEPGKTMSVAQPEPVDGKRAVAFVDGHVELVEEKTFRQKAKAQGWKLPNKDPESEKADSDFEKKVNALVVQLGDPDPAVRKQARRALKKLGDAAEEILKTHRNHPDLEIRLTIRDLLE